MLKNGNPSGHGGARRGAGRKPRAATILKQRIIENKAEEADASLAFCVDIRNNIEEPGMLRFVAAREVMDRVWGKAVVMQADAGTELYKAYFEKVRKTILGDVELEQPKIETKPEQPDSQSGPSEEPNPGEELYKAYSEKVKLILDGNGDDQIQA